VVRNRNTITTVRPRRHSKAYAPTFVMRSPVVSARACTAPSSLIVDKKRCEPSDSLISWHERTVSTCTQNDDAHQVATRRTTGSSLRCSLRNTRSCIMGTTCLCRHSNSTAAYVGQSSEPKQRGAPQRGAPPLYSQLNPSRNQLGIRTVSITWITPLVAAMSTAVTWLLPFSTTFPSATAMFTMVPCTVAASVNVVTTDAGTLPEMT